MRHRTLIAFGRATALGALVALVVVAVAPRLAGLSPLTVLSGSMSPVLEVGDVVIDEHVAPTAVRPGDIVSFNDTTRGNALVTHRVRAVRRVGARVNVVTRGDANNADERWSVPADGRIGRVRWRIPKVGYVLHALGRPIGRIALITIPALILIALELASVVAVLRTPRDRASASAPTAG